MSYGDSPKEKIGKQYSEQEVEILPYLRQEIRPDKHAWMKESYGQILLKAAEKNPVEALARWQKVSGDYSFLSSSDALLDPQQRNINEMSDKQIELNSNPLDPTYKDILKAYQQEQKEAQREVAVQELISLSERYSRTSWNDPERNKIDKELSRIVETYKKDEEFQQKIEDSQSDAAIQKLNEEIQMRECQLSPGMSLNM